MPSMDGLTRRLMKLFGNDSPNFKLYGACIQHVSRGMLVWSGFEPYNQNWVTWILRGSRHSNLNEAQHPNRDLSIAFCGLLQTQRVCMSDWMPEHVDEILVESENYEDRTRPLGSDGKVRVVIARARARSL